MAYFALKSKSSKASAAASGPKLSARLDPYWIWPRPHRSGGDGYSHGSGEPAESTNPRPAWTHLLVQTARPAIPYLLSLGFMPVHVHATGANKTRATCYVSGLVDQARLGQFLKAARAEDSLIVRFEHAAPRDRGNAAQEVLKATQQTAAKWPSDGSLTQLAQDLKAYLQNEAPIVKEPGEQEKPTPKPAPLVCVIDDRSNAFSEGLLGGPQTLDWSMWHQGGEVETLNLLKKSQAFDEALELIWSDDKPPKLPRIARIRGALLGRRSKTTPVGDNGMESYKKQLIQWPPPATSHGSAVLDLIRGRALWAGHPPNGPEWICRKVFDRARPQRVHFVQLPIPTVVDTSGGSLAASVLDGLHDALDHAEPNQDVIVNISFGTHSGGHDGTSMLEGAICELLSLYDGTSEAQGKKLHVVLPAGNSHLLRCHAMGTLCPHPNPGQIGPKHTLLWKVQPDSPVDSFMEIWLDESAEVVVSMRAPDGSTSCAKLGPAQAEASLPASWMKKEEKLIAGIIHPLRPAQGLKGRMVLLAVTATAKQNAPWEVQMFPGVLSALGLTGNKASPRALSPHGIWTITLATNGRARLPFHAWIQRGDTAPLRGRSSRGFGGRQSYFLDTPDGGVDPCYTLNGIASFKHDRLYVVGAMRHSDNCLASYSAAGPNRGETSRCEGPNWVVRADESRNVPGLLVSGFHGGAWYRVAGTSMAAAAFTRHLYEHICKYGSDASFQRRPHEDDQCHSASFDAACKELVPAGAPEHAHPLHRGIWQRLVPSNADGSL